MSATTAITKPFSAHLADTCRDVGAAIQGAAETTARKIKEFASSRLVQGTIGFGLGMAMPLIYGPITERLVTSLGASLTDPFTDMGLGTKIALAPLICIAAPFIEEFAFRGTIQDKL